MSSDRPFDRLSREERIALCREVMENLSELAEGTAPPDLCERVESLLGDCQPYRAYRDTLRATLDLLHECGEQVQAPDATFRNAVDRARAALEAGRPAAGGRDPGPGGTGPGDPDADGS